MTPAANLKLRRILPSFAYKCQTVEAFCARLRISILTNSKNGRGVRATPTTINQSDKTSGTVLNGAWKIGR